MKWNELDEALEQGLDAFHCYLKQQEKSVAGYFEQFYWSTDGVPRTVLNYLIHRHIESDGQKENFTAIDCVLALTKNKKACMPVHQAIIEGKTSLALHLLTKLQMDLETGFDSNQRDHKGRTLLSLALAQKNSSMVAALLAAQASVHSPNYIDTVQALLQPIHQAVLLNDAEGIRLLAQYGANLSAPSGLAQDTPLLLAAHWGQIEALAALLALPVDQLNLEAERVVDQNNRYTAIEALCFRLQQGKNIDSALQGIALLLCHGAKPPCSPVLRGLLSRYRSSLLQKIEDSLNQKPQLINAFIVKCHQRESALHNLIYAPHSWENARRYLWGMPGNAALVMEELLVKKHNEWSENAYDPCAEGRVDTGVQTPDSLTLYALFVKRYSETYKNQLFSNPWSTMRWMIANGQCDWDTVQAYVQTNPNSRSAIVYHDLMNAKSLTSHLIKQEVTSEEQSDSVGENHCALMAGHLCNG